MADKLIIVMVNTDQRNAAELGAPFFQAAVAAAMDYDVEVILTARAGERAKKGVAEMLYLKEGSGKSVSDLIKDVPEAGPRLKVCAPILQLGDNELIPQMEESVGGAYVIEQAIDDPWSPLLIEGCFMVHRAVPHTHPL